MDARHRDREQLVAITLIELDGQPMALVAEYKPIALLKTIVVQTAIRLRTAEYHPPRLGALQEIVPILIDVQVQVRPVIQPCPAKMCLVQGKPQRANQVKRRIRADAQTTDRTRVLGNLRGNQNNIETRLETFFHLTYSCMIRTSLARRKK
jgi:hypothetical protein